MHVISGEIERRVTHARRSRLRGSRVALACAATVIMVGIAACSSGGSGGASGTSGAPKPSANLITADEIGRVNVQNAYEAVQKLRPAMLRVRQIASANGQGGAMGAKPTGSSVSAGELLVYMDNNRLGSADQLRQISASTVAALRYYSASEAQTKWGSGHAGGVIEVITKR